MKDHSKKRKIVIKELTRARVLAARKKTEISKKMTAMHTTLKDHKLSKALVKCRNALIKIPGPKMTRFLQKVAEIRATVKNEKGGSLGGAQARNLVKNRELPKLVFGRGNVEVGHDILENLVFTCDGRRERLNDFQKKSF